jgi:hypothetical protein
MADFLRDLCESLAYFAVRSSEPQSAPRYRKKTTPTAASRLLNRSQRLSLKLLLRMELPNATEAFQKA